jgi:uncharacterized protein YbcI
MCKLSTESSLKQIILIKTIAYFSTSENLKKLYETRTVVITSIEKKKKRKTKKTINSNVPSLPSNLSLYLQLSSLSAENFPMIIIIKLRWQLFF